MNKYLFPNQLNLKKVAVKHENLTFDMADSTIPPTLDVTNNSKPEPLYFGLSSEFLLEDRFGRPIQWTPIPELCRQEFLEETQLFLGDLPSLKNPTSASSGDLKNPTAVRSGDLIQQPLTLKTPANVKSIHFYGRVTQLQFEILMVPLVNLKTLEIHLWSLAHLTLTHTLVRLEVLSNLKISSTNFGPEEAEKCDMEVVFVNAIYLINLHLPGLKYLALSMPTVFSKETRWTEGILRALIKNKSIKSLLLESPFPLGTTSSNEKVFEFPPRYEQGLKNLHLKTFHYSVTVPTISTNFWRKLSLLQGCLEYFHFWVEHPGTPFPVESLEVLVRNNHATLVTLAISYLGLEPGPVLNGTTFQHCTKLQTLYLVGDLESALPGGTSEIPSFRFFNLLPYSLVTLRLHNIRLSLTDTKFISNNLQNLKHLELINIGQHESLGLSFDNLTTIMSKKTLERVEVVRGVNRSSLNVVSDERGWKNIAKILFQRQRSSTWFRARRETGQKTFEIIQDSSDGEPNSDDDEDELYTSSSTSCQETDLELNPGGMTGGRNQIHEDDMTRLLNSNARKLYGNAKFNLATTSSDNLNRNE